MRAGESSSHQALGTDWERRTTWTAAVFAGVTFLLLAVASFVLDQTGKPIWVTLSFSVVVALLVYFGMTRKIRRRRRILSQPFPDEWEQILLREVIFYRTLSSDARAKFRRELQVFLGEKLITGIKTDVDDTTRVLAAASAIIPIFGFSAWEWDQISEILIYPSRFDEHYRMDDGCGKRTLGMVGTGAMHRMMILSKPDLIQGFRNPADKRNVGLHEFAHLVDKSDGAIDGLPGLGLDRKAIGPWVELVRRKMQEIREGKSDIDPYALTNEAEFFAVASEYFFERPGVMERKHPELYAMLSRVFNQDLRSRVKAITKEIKRGRPSFGRNEPCPCGSGVKYKKCCLKRARRARRAATRSSRRHGA